MAPDPRRSDATTQKTALQQFFLDIRRDIETASTRRELTALYQRAHYLITLTHARVWEAKFGQKVIEIRRIATEEFATTARELNRRATQLGISANYDAQWTRER